MLQKDTQILQSQIAAESNFEAIVQLKKKLAVVNDTSVQNERQSCAQEVSIVPNQTNVLEAVTSEGSPIVHDHEVKSPSEPQKWFEWRGVVLALVTCLGVVSIGLLARYIKRCQNNAPDNAPSPEPSLGDRDGMARLQEMSLHMRRNAPKKPAFGMREIGPPTRGEGASEIKLADVIVETPRDVGQEGETTQPCLPQETQNVERPKFDPGLVQRPKSQNIG